MSVFLGLTDKESKQVQEIIAQCGFADQRNNNLTTHLRQLVSWYIKIANHPDAKGVIKNDFLGNTMSFLDSAVASYLRQKKTEKI